MTHDEYRDIFRQYLNKMPDDSLNAFGNIKYISEIMYTATNDVYFLIEGVKEYERRIDALNRIYREDQTRLPYLYKKRDFIKDYMTHIYTGIASLEGKDRIRINRYLDNRIKLTPMYITVHMSPEDEKLFSCDEDFIEFFDSDAYPQELRAYLKYKTYAYRDYNNQHIIRSQCLVDSMIKVENAAAENRERYKKCLEEMFVELIEPEVRSGMVSRKYLNKINYYLSYGPTVYYDKVSKVKKIIKESKGAYSKELNQYLKELGAAGFTDDRMNLILNDYSSKKKEIDEYSRTKENYIELNEIKVHNAVEVWSAEEFLSAIKDNAVIKVMDDIRINCVKRKISDKVSVSSKRVGINNVKNITIIGDGEYPVNISVDTYMEALAFSNCENINLRNVSVGHTYTACSGPVIGASDSSGILVEDSIIYGCGVIGLDYLKAKNVAVRNTLIWDCRQEGIKFIEVEDAELNNVVITSNGTNQPYYEKCKDIEEISVQVD